MAAKLSTFFLGYGLIGLDHQRVNFLAFPSSARRFVPTYCKIRPRNLSSQVKRQAKKASPGRPPKDIDLNPDRDEVIESESVTTERIPSLNDAILSNNDIDTSITVDHISEEELHETKSLVINREGADNLSNIRLQDLIAMIKNAEKNVLLLNEARLHALGYLQKILNEKESLQGEINILDMRLSETDAMIRVAAQEKVNVKLLEDQLEKLQNELTHRSGNGKSEFDMFGIQNNKGTPELHHTVVHSFSDEISLLRTENMSLKNDIEGLKAELNNVKHTDERVVSLEKERALLESDMKDLQSKLSASQDDVSKLSHLTSECENLHEKVEGLKAELNNAKHTDERVIILEKEHSTLESNMKDLESKLYAFQEDVSKLSLLKSECKDLNEKVEHLQALLDKATRQADQTILVLHQNKELQMKVDKLEESVEEVKIYKLSSEKIQNYNEQMQQKIILLEEHLQRSEEEIHSYVQLYQESVKEFQDTLDNLKEESEKRDVNKSVDDMPSEFWSRVLLIIDGWLLENKLSSSDAKQLREMVKNRDGQIRDAYLDCKGKNEREALSIFLQLILSPNGSGLHIIHIAAEMAPVAKVGGLGDVLTGLSKALQKRGHLVEVVIPKYDCMEYDRIRDLRVLDVVLESYFDGKLFKNKVWVGTVEGLPVYFIEPHHPAKFFWRGQFYGEIDDFKRFSYFSRAALELLLQAGKKPDIIHCHDWQTAFVAPLYWDLYAPKGLNSARICFTCHNFEYQGTAPASELGSCGLDVHQQNRPDRMQDNSAHDRINPIKGAIVFSNIVTTVSPTYAQEVKAAEGGCGLHSTLNLHSKKFVGILNGIDTDAWNPATDPFLNVQYSAHDLQGKAENKLALRKDLGLSFLDPRQPLVGCITRLVPQKGVHLIRHAIYRTLELGGQFVLLGSSPVPHIQREFEGIANHFQNHEHIQLILKYDESLSHSIYAASDMFIIPSIFEPCGLTQLIAMRYGSIPIARKTGGLNDSVFDVDDTTIPLQFRNGFTFLNPDEQGVNGALERAMNYYINNKDNWEQLVQKDMNIDFSWESSSQQYEDLYLKSLARARAATRG